MPDRLQNGMENAFVYDIPYHLGNVSNKDYWKVISMKAHNSIYKDMKKKDKVRKFRDFYDDAYNEADEQDFLRRKKKLGKKRRFNRSDEGC